ncbi:vWA domain-containing protein [Bacillus sp. B-jedd]|uniref:vWA domain-containing protein n=1 Tax=Bacillus sp. B-jedd TaxID=1476857 RepID=UPI00051568B9|nr:VWA domain-containing protein [Bacillus sp. B-jedd]CEG26404.1 D-amino acid dehydrogenase, large subunit [Bacillus sp. B-jedd]
MQKKVLACLLCLIFLFAGCSKSDSEKKNMAAADAKEKKTETADAKEKDTEAADTKKEEPEKQSTSDDELLWPDAFQPNTDISFAFPATMGEAENHQEGLWWGKLKNGQLTDQDKDAVLKKLEEINASSISNSEKGSQIKQFLTETYFPNLPGLSTFEPRGKISLEDVEAKSNIKLNGREMKEQINVAIILDASGSMKQVKGGKTLMEMAKDSISEFSSGLPDNAKVSLTVYGHKGTGSDSDKQLSCSSIDEIYPLSAYNADSFATAVNSVSPSGWTSMARSLKQAGEKLGNNSDATNVIYLVSDGKETCDGNPAAEAKALAQSNINPIINVIGLSVNGEDAAQLKQIADSAGGRYIDAKNQQDLDREFDQSSNTLSQWSDWFRQNITKASDQLTEDKKRLSSLHDETIRNMGLFHHESLNALSDLFHTGNLDVEISKDVHDTLVDFYGTLFKEKDQLFGVKLKQIDETFSKTQDEMSKKFNKK